MIVARFVSVRFVPGFAALAAALVLAGGCGGSSGAKPTLKCVHDSECSGALVCIQGYCVGKCTSSKDCVPSGRCIEAAEGPTCQAPEKVTCHYNSDCTQPLICSGDFTCRSQCQTKADCPTGQFCTTISKLCADPAVDKSYDPTTNEFMGADAAFGAGKVAPDASAGDVPTSDGAGGAGGAGGSNADASPGDADAAALEVASQPEVGIATSCPGTPKTLFSRIATGDTNPGYVTGLGLRLPTEMVIFNGFTGYDDVPDAGADAGGDAAAPAPKYVNRIDIQRFDLQGVSKGPSTRWNVVEGVADLRNPESIYVNGVSAAPTGEVALVYSSGNADGYSIYLDFLAPSTLAVTQKIQLQSLLGTHFGHQAHVQWENGQFVASWVSFNTTTNGFFLNMAAYLKDGTPTGSASSIPTDQTGRTSGGDYEQAAVAFLGGLFAISYENVAADIPSLTFLGTDFNKFGPTQPMPYSVAGMPDSSRFTVVGATTKGFVGLYNGQIPQADGGAPTTYSTLATFVSPPASADGGATVGTTVTLPGVASYNFQNGARSSSDALGAGFALLTTDGKATFAYFTDDGTKHLGPSQVIQQGGNATDRDMAHLMNLDGSYALSLYTRAEHLTRMAVSGCPATTN